MTKNTLALEQQSSRKEKGDGKTYRIPISNGIFEHYQKLKDARWLLDLYVDWTTKEIPSGDGSFNGIVLGGKPICDEDTAGSFGCSMRTTRRWRERLARYGYIAQKRTPIGYVIIVKKSKKWPERSSKNVRSDRTKMSSHSESELPIMSDQNYQVCPIRTTDHVLSNIDRAVQGSDRAVEEETATASFRENPKLQTKDTHPSWAAIGQRPFGPSKFRQVWETIYGEQSEDLLTSEVMEIAIQECNSQGIRVPPPFYQAKHKIEAEARSHGSHEDSFPTHDEIACMGGLRPPQGTW